MFAAAAVPKDVQRRALTFAFLGKLLRCLATLLEYFVLSQTVVCDATRCGTSQIVELPKFGDDSSGYSAFRATENSQCAICNLCKAV